MKYVGSKSRHTKDILPIILRDRKPDQWYVEPFMGGCNVLCKVTGNRIGNDLNRFVVSMFLAVVDGWIPPDKISESEYHDIRENKDRYPPQLVGFVGIGCSYAGKWWGGYARGNGRNYCLESKNNILKQAGPLKGVRFSAFDFETLHIPENSLVYCDPPYFNTTKYQTEFESNRFWCWVRGLVDSGNKVFVSEYNSPKDFISVFEKTVNNTLEQNTGKKTGIEKLFVHKSQYTGAEQ